MKKIFVVLFITICVLCISLIAADKVLTENGVKAVVLKENLYRIEGTREGTSSFWSQQKVSWLWIAARHLPRARKSSRPSAR